MIALLALAALQQAPDTAQYSSPALRALVARAEAANAAPTPGLLAYSARYESEVAMVKLLPGRIEGASTIEQTAGQFTWVRGKGYGQHQEGYRVVTTGVPLPAAAALSKGWIVPNLAGPEYDVFGASSGAATLAGIDSSGRFSVNSPLAPDRDLYYRFEGGDTVTMEFPVGPPQRVVRLVVWPRDSLPQATKLFRGNLYLDPESGVVRRLRGQFLTLGGPPLSGKAKLVNSLALNAAVADIVTTEVPGAGWLPTWQLIDLEVLIPLTTESWSMVRVITTLQDADVSVQAAGAPAPPLPAFLPGRTSAPKDSLGSYRQWTKRAERAVTDFSPSDLFSVGPLPFRPVGPPELLWRGPTTLEAIRFNRVEGLYLGASGTLYLRDALPGLRVRGTAGYAIWPGLFRGGVTGTLVRGQWATNVQAMRDLDLTTKFPDPLDYNRGVRALFQADNYDYADRLTVGAGETWFFARRSPSYVSARVDWIKDRRTVADLSEGPLGQAYTLNPTVIAYDYPRVQVGVNWNPEISSHFIRPGIGLHATYEAGGGDLPYQRIQAGIVLRANWKSVTFTLVGDAGTTISDNPPTQQMFLIGGSGTLPGYDYDQFGGNVGVLTRWMIQAPLPFLQSPLKIGGATIPPIAPNLSYRVYNGYTETTSAAADSSLAAVGTVVVNGVSQPFSVPSDGIVSTQEIRLSLFGTLLGFGIARPFASGADWTFTFSFAQSF